MCTSHGGTQQSYQPGSRVYALQRGHCTNADLLGQWRKSYHDITTKTSCIKYTWSPTSQWYQQASPAGACLHDKLRHVVGLQWMHELHQQTCCVKYTSLIPHQPVVPAGLPCWCLLTWQASRGGSTMNACVQWMHELHQQYSSQNSFALPAKGWAIGFLPKCAFCGALDLQLMPPSEVSHSSSKLTPWYQSLCPLYSPMMQ